MPRSKEGFPSKDQLIRFRGHLINGSQPRGIEWTDATWNPVTGCTRTSPGCDHCYAERMAKRLQAMGNPRYTNGFAPTLHWDKVSEPLKWRQPRRIFVNSMSDLFHDAVPPAFVRAVFDTMAAAHWHEFQILTKRARRLPKIAGDLQVAAQRVVGGIGRVARIRVARGLSARGARRLCDSLSVEPLVGPVGNPGLWTASAGSSWAARADRAPGRWMRSGRVRSAISAWPRPSRSSSSNGVACANTAPAAPSTDARGMSFPWRRQEPKRRASSRL